MKRAIWSSALVAGVFILTANNPANAQENRSYPPNFPDAKAEVYKTVGDVELKIHIFTPEGHRAEQQRAAIVFFFGGGWTNGSPTQFVEQCRHLASRGMVAMTADYRVRSRHSVMVRDCVEDAKAAIRWARTHASRLGIDPNRIAAGGGSAGGHLAASTGTLPEFDGKRFHGVSSVPNAMVLFNPAVVLDRVDGETFFEEAKFEGLKKRMGVDPHRVSPFHHLRKGTAPAIILHGTKDASVAFRSVELFTDKMVELGNRCELVAYEGQEHGFFNFGRGDGKYYEHTLKKVDEFLVSLGYLEGEATVTDTQGIPVT